MMVYISRPPPYENHIINIKPDVHDSIYETLLIIKIQWFDDQIIKNLIWNHEKFI
jgi:hypothetical protein